MPFKFTVEHFATTRRGRLYAVSTRDLGEFVLATDASLPAYRCTGGDAACRDGVCSHVQAVKDGADKGRDWDHPGAGSQLLRVQSDNPTATARSVAILADRGAA